MRKLLPLLGGILLGLGLGIVIFFGILQDESSIRFRDLDEESVSFLVPSLNAPAPGFELHNLDGERVRLDDYRGKIIILNFWATWCAPCRLEMPVFQEIFEEKKDGLVVLAVNNAEDQEDVQVFAEDLELTFDILLDPSSETQKLFQVQGYPTTFLIDHDGVIRFRHIGLMTEDQLNQYINELNPGN